MLRHLKIKNQSFGFSLIELLVVLLLIGLLSNTAVAYWRDVVQQQQADHVAELLRGALNRARLYSMDFNQSVIACGINASLQPDVTLSDWSRGIAIFIDQDQSETFSVKDTVLETLALLSSAGSGQVSRAGNTPYFEYRHNGALNKFTGNVTYVPASGDVGLIRRVVLNYAGRVYVEKGS